MRDFCKARAIFDYANKYMLDATLKNIVSKNALGATNTTPCKRIIAYLPPMMAFLGLEAMRKSFGLIKSYATIIVNGELKIIVEVISSLVLTTAMTFIATPFIKLTTLVILTSREISKTLILYLFRRILNLVFILRGVTIPLLTGHDPSGKTITPMTFHHVTMSSACYWEDLVWRIKSKRRKSPNLLGQMFQKILQQLWPPCLPGRYFQMNMYQHLLLSQ